MRQERDTDLGKYIEANRAHWNEVTPIHEGSAFYDIESFKAGRNTLHRIELEAVGDVSGKSLLHLQCHFGQDTLSWARLGGKVTGVDISDDSIALARSLADELRIDAHFIRSNVYDLPQALSGIFDIVFSSYGCLLWLPDMQSWANVVSHFLRPGGTFFMVEFHPVANIFDDERRDGRLEVRYPYFNGGEPVEWLPDGTGSYADRDAVINTATYEWPHSLGEVVTALASSGLRIEHLHEFRHSVYQHLAIMQQGDDGMWCLPDKTDSVPLMYSIKASKSELP